MNIITNTNDHPITIGLDIGSSTIRCAIGQIIQPKGKIKLLGISSVQSGGIQNGVITDRDELIEALEKVLTDAEIMANIKVESVTLSITGENIRSMNTQAAIALNRVNGTINGINNRAIENADMYQVLNLAQAVSLPVDRDILHTIPQEYIVDTLNNIKNPIGMTGRRLEARVHLVTAASTAINNLVSSVEELGITVDGLVFQPLASALATLEKDEMDLGVTLVEFGSNSTNIAVYYNNAVRHSATIPIGSASITNDIAVMLQISINEAENIKKKYASALSSMSSDKLDIKFQSNNDSKERSITEKKVSQYVEARIQEIFQMIIREVSRADIKDPLTYGIVMTGGGAELRNIISLAEHSLGVKVRKGNPNKIEGTHEIANKPHFTTVMGLLLWPTYSNDHIRIHQSNLGSLKNIINKIRHTIENMF
ncbi:MAG: cell division protein FtsA [Candidatus Marinimicrobia bacterium]|nr:cell division protein FtsA [Candidatus Neomarinimicrobiota bacterium]|tara:strand:+ start:579 stop:1856 length:1278 start_codon:yes stop_codon:yes gene_type:complete